jgi:DNA helicase-2/ATP-dependent DNA helicase PcrA
MRFYERKEIKDVLAYLKAVFNPHDSLCLKRIVNVPLRGIGKGTVDKIENYAKEKDISFFRGLEEVVKKNIIAPSIKKRLEGFLKLMKRFTITADRKSVSHLVKEILTKTRFIELMGEEDREKREERLENIKEFISAVEEFEKRAEDRSLGAFLDYTSLISQEDFFDEESGAVSLMTLHSSKGLEFPVVFISGIENGLSPHSKSFETIEEMEEERRLFYVGMTRAKARLFLTNCIRRNIFGHYQHHFPSMFLHDIPCKYLSQEKTLHPSPSSEAERRDTFEGIRIHHPEFGLGIVKESEGEGDDLKLTVLFERFGKKKLVAKYASLKEL